MKRRGSTELNSGVKRKNRRQELYIAKERGIAEAWRNANTGGSLIQFKNSEIGKQWYADFKLLNSNPSEPIQYPSRGRLYHNQESNSTSDTPIREPTSSTSRDEATTTEAITSFTTDSNDLFGRDPELDLLLSMFNSPENMDVASPPLISAVNTLRNRDSSSATGGRSQANALGSTIEFPLSTANTTFNISFHKTRFMFSYAYANKQTVSICE